MGFHSLAWRWAPPVLYLALVFLVSRSPTVPATGIYGLDKLIHFTEFAVLGLLLARAAGRPTSWRGWILMLVVGFISGAIDELIQSGVPGRCSSIWDFTADAAGVTAGVCGGHRFWKLRPVRRLA